MSVIKTDYCVRCDTVWASPGKCRCVNINDPEFFKHTSKLDIWNAAIEAAAKLAEDQGDYCYYVEQIRKLKK